MKIHPREALVNESEKDLRELLHDIQFKRDLTDGEYFRVLCVAFAEVGVWAKYKIREERHGDSNKPGGLA